MPQVEEVEPASAAAATESPLITPVTTPVPPTPTSSATAPLLGNTASTRGNKATSGVRKIEKFFKELSLPKIGSNNFSLFKNGR
jgi:hypothetical protein